tara:strand:+ start:1945 stop:2586 length:642 start_codon:yes stop_codon:yes gene_type:complete
MKVNISKNGKKESYTLIDNWSDVTLEKWASIIAIKEKSTTKEALETITALSDIPRKLVSQLAVTDVANIMTKLAEMQKSSNNNLKNIIEIEGMEYAFHPDLERITLGEYADLESFITDGVEKNLANIMAILYRPITKKVKENYLIQAYDGQISLRAEAMKKMKAEDVHSALVFFWTFAKTLSTILPLCLADRVQKIVDEQQTNSSQVNGAGSE